MKMDFRLIKVFTDFFELLTRLEANIDFEKNPDEFKKELLHNLYDTKTFFEEKSEENYNAYKKHFFFHDLNLQFIIYLHISLKLLILENIFLKDSFKHIKSGSFSSQCLTAFTPTLSNLIHSLLVIRLTLKNGFNIQANQLMRSYIEYADIGIAMLANQEFFDNYKNMVDSPEQEKKVWWDYIRHKSITKILEKALNEISPNHEHWDILFKIRDPMYKNASNHIHGHSGINIFGMYDTPLDKSNEQNFGLGGNITKEIESTYLNILIYAHEFIANSTACIVYYHDLPFKHFGQDGEDFTRCLKMSEKFREVILKVHLEGRKSNPT